MPSIDTLITTYNTLSLLEQANNESKQCGTWQPCKAGSSCTNITVHGRNKPCTAINKYDGYCSEYCKNRLVSQLENKCCAGDNCSTYLGTNKKTYGEKSVVYFGFCTNGCLLDNQCNAKDKCLQFLFDNKKHPKNCEYNGFCTKICWEKNGGTRELPCKAEHKCLSLVFLKKVGVGNLLHNGFCTEVCENTNKS